VTIFEASISLYSWYAENDIFSMSNYPDMVRKMNLFKENEAQDKAAFRCALQQLENMALISKTEVNKKEYWVLSRNLSCVEQEVKLSAETCLSISQVVNTFCEVIDDIADECDPTEVKEKDIKNLTYIAGVLLSKKDK
jgi:uncharacterized UPF0160 family protein|tara:strand:- start:7079 stop:7492 length:414 start_codon:yes stop_codon:yes gene_type:complete